MGKSSLSSSDPTGLDYVRDKPEKVMEDQDEFFIEDFDAAPVLHLYNLTFREDHSDFDDNSLYAARDRTTQLRSFKVLPLSNKTSFQQ